MASFESYNHVLREAGYVPGPPPPGPAEIDREAALQSRCENCDRKGLVFHPYRKAGSYRALAVCLSCGEAIEF